jgi:hypothetical protein
MSREAFIKMTSLYIKIIVKLPEEKWMLIPNGVYYQKEDAIDINVLNFYEDFFKDQMMKEKKKSDSRSGWRN